MGYLESEEHTAEVWMRGQSLYLGVNCIYEVSDKQSAITWVPNSSIKCTRVENY